MFHLVDFHSRDITNYYEDF
nr:truncated ORF6 protein [Severe acute respiratory syndrome coronavirus 2]